VATIESFVPVLDLGGTFVFAISGAVAAVNRRLDIFGILVLSFVTGNLGGITRDVLIGAAPPAALTDGRYLLVSVLAGLITFFWYAGVNRLRAPRPGSEGPRRRSSAGGRCRGAAGHAVGAYKRDRDDAGGTGLRSDSRPPALGSGERLKSGCHHIHVAGRRFEGFWH
jgi:Glycine transporter